MNCVLQQKLFFQKSFSRFIFFFIFFVANFSYWRNYFGYKLDFCSIKSKKEAIIERFETNSSTLKFNKFVKHLIKEWSINRLIVKRRAQLNLIDRSTIFKPSNIYIYIENKITMFEFFSILFYILSLSKLINFLLFAACIFFFYFACLCFSCVF